MCLQNVMMYYDLSYFSVLNIMIKTKTPVDNITFKRQFTMNIDCSMIRNYTPLGLISLHARIEHEI